MLYFHDMICLSPAAIPGTVNGSASQELFPVSGISLRVAEPAYPGIPPNVLRRMGKCVRMCVGLSLPLTTKYQPDGIIIGTANGGMEDCIKFLNQIIEYEEGKLTPGNFVQSTANGPAAQLALVSRNRQYNITHVHRGLAFEQALLDAVLLLLEDGDRSFLVGAVDEISSYNLNIDRLAGWYRETSGNSHDLFRHRAKGTIAGEGGVTMIVSGKKTGAAAWLRDMKTIHTEDLTVLENTLADFLQKNEVGTGGGWLLISGESGDERLAAVDCLAEKLVPESTPVLRYKHLTGEYPTATSFAVWLSAQIFSGYRPPGTMIKKGFTEHEVQRIIIYNSYRGLQHAFLLLERPS